MEELMQYVWRFRLWPELNMTAADGRHVSVLDPGTLNTGSGPDFFNAKVRINGQMWAGNVEIHVRASDWHRHGHDGDPAYDNVILHVVQYDDTEIRRRTDDAVIPQVTMRCAADFSERYRKMVHNTHTELPCADEIGTLHPVVLSDWITALGMERLQRKADDIRAVLDNTAGDWHAAAYITLARAMGFGSNADPMERLARAVPLNILLRHSDDQAAIEAILLGRAGLLRAENPRDTYEESLAQEYAFYSRQYGLTDDGHPLQWQRRQRPHNAPERRIAALAAMIAGGFTLAGAIMGLSDEDPRILFEQVRMGPYWQQNVNFGHPGTASPAMSAESIRLLCINLVAPLMYAAAEQRGDMERCAAATDLLHGLKAESNTITRLFQDAGLRCDDAFTSQALIQLRRNYCEQRKCLFCRIGHRLLQARVKA